MSPCAGLDEAVENRARYSGSGPCPPAPDSMDVTADHSPADPGAKPAASPARAGPWARAFAVHVLTACGAALCLLALLAAIAANWSLMFVWLGLALVIDAIDGTLARHFQVQELLPDSAAIPAGLLILVTSALYFADRRMKTPDNYFRGFPALWNVVAFYLFLLRPGPWPDVALVVMLCGLSFVPFPFVHPLRVARFRGFNVVLLLAWSVLAVATVVKDMEPGTPVKLALVALAVCFLASGLLRGPVAPAS